MDEIAERLLTGNEKQRIAALKKLPTSADVDWWSLNPYFIHVLQPSSRTNIEELSLAVDVAVRAPLRSIHERVVLLAEQGRGEGRAQALMGLARIGETVGEGLVEVLTSEKLEGPRGRVAEHLLLIDVSPVRHQLEALRRKERDPEVRFWLASALARVGNYGALKEELGTKRVPRKLRARVRESGSPQTIEAVAEDETFTKDARATEDVAEGGGGPARVEDVTYTVEPRIERVEPPAYMDVSHAQPPSGEAHGAAPGEAPTVEVRGEDAADITSKGPPGPPRYFEGRAPDRVRLGETVAVQLRVAISPSPAAHSKELILDVPAEGLTLRITGHTPGFELEGGQQLQELFVPAGSDSDWILYRLRALHESVHDLIFTAFHPEGRMLGELVIQVSVDALATTAESRETRSDVHSMHGEEGEVSLTIDWLEETDTYRFQLVDRSFPEEVLTDRLLRTPRQIVESLIGDLDAMAKNNLGSGQDMRAMLRERGVQLWNELIPKALQNQFWERQSRITSLRILARRDPIPWEVLYPLSESNDAGFLVEQFPVIRSIRGLQPVNRIGSGPVETVVPSTGAPSSATAETQMVRQLWAARSGGGEISDLASLRSTLQQAKFGILHLACHNAFDPGDANRTNIKFGNQQFAPVVLAPMIATRSLAAARPLVFLNACRSAGEAPLYTELSGWASDFMRAGAAVFVGSLWAVRDQPAKAFAQTFYESMNGGSNVGAAIMKARKSVSNNSDPTWLAYTAYGDPTATI